MDHCAQLFPRSLGIISVEFKQQFKTNKSNFGSHSSWPKTGNEDVQLEVKTRPATGCCQIFSCCNYLKEFFLQLNESYWIYFPPISQNHLKLYSIIIQRDSWQRWVTAFPPRSLQNIAETCRNCRCLLTAVFGSPLLPVFFVVQQMGAHLGSELVREWRESTFYLDDWNLHRKKKGHVQSERLGADDEMSS